MKNAEKLTQDLMTVLIEFKGEVDTKHAHAMAKLQIVL